MIEFKHTTKVDLENGSPAFAKPVLYEVPTYLAGCPIGTLNRKTKRKKAMAKINCMNYKKMIKLKNNGK